MYYLSTFWKPILEIGVVWAVVYFLLLFIKGTRAIQVLKGLVILFITFFAAQIFQLNIINWLLTKIFAISIIALLIIFQPELRRGLAHLGRNRWLRFLAREEKTLEEIIKAINLLSQQKIGALIIIAKETGLRNYIEAGISLDADLSKELILSIFNPRSPLHDGGIIVHEGRIASCRCFFPLTDKPRLSKNLGTRHRAAIGLSEESDAICIVVSEETGEISLAIDGKLSSNLENEKLKKNLSNLYIKNGGEKKLHFGFQIK
ncbi:MAG: diadenylate cyclase CdaA [Candidatus Omnitrophica bacterium]|nr:diadenylate cyclase CdaA [Candidatus Omnitrophota bacterium]